MVDTPNLGITHITQGQAGKEVTANEAFDELDQAGQDTVDIVTTAGGTIVVTALEYTRNNVLKLTGTPAANFTLEIPNTKRRFVVQNASGKIATVQTATPSATQGVDNGILADLYCDGNLNVESVLSGGAGGSLGPFTWKDAVRAGTTAPLTLATDFENGDTVDGVVLATGDRILIKDQATGADNGIYTVNATGAPTRSTDADQDAEVLGGMAVVVNEGTINAEVPWILATNDPITVGSTALSFVRFGAGTYLSMGDTPNSYTGQQGKVPRVKTAEDGLEFLALTAGTRVELPFRGALLKNTATTALGAGSNILDWDSAVFDSGIGDPQQRFWLGPDFDFVDADVTVGTDNVNEVAHGFVTGEGPFRMTTTGVLPAGLALATNYWAIRVDDDNFKVATTRVNAIANTPVDITAAAGGGTHTIERGSFLVVPAGVTKMQFRVQSEINLLAGLLQIKIIKNGALGDGLCNVEFTNSAAGTELHQAQTAVVVVTEGDRFEVDFDCADAAALIATDIGQWVQMEVVETDVSENPPLDVAALVVGQPAVNSIVLKYVATRAFELPVALAGSEAHAEVAFTAAKVFDVLKNGSSVGSINFAISATVATFVMASLTSFAVGDRLTVTAPAVLDVTGADIGITLKGTRI